VSKQIVKIEDPNAGERRQLSSWALVELFGRQRIVGRLTEETFGSAVLFRIDVPDLMRGSDLERSGFTRYFGVGAIYSITPIAEELVRSLLPEIDGAPARLLSFSSYDA
jgi:hypothetical protein